MPGLASTVATRKLGMSNVATLQRDSVPTNLNQTNVQPVYDIYASAQGRDLGSISHDLGKIVSELQKELKPGNTIQVTEIGRASCRERV